MKLINLRASSGDFTNVFSSDILIEPNSKIALTQANINLSVDNIVINNENNIVYFQVGATEPQRIISLPPGNYNKTELVEVLNIALNSALDITGGYEQGFMWKVSTVDDKLNIKFNRSDYATLPYTIKANIAELNGKFTKNTNTTVYDSYGGTAKTFINGCGTYSATVNNDAGISLVDMNLVFGFLSGKAQGATLPPTNYEYGIYINNGVYNIVIKNVIGGTLQPTNYALGDKLIIELTEGDLDFKIKRADNSSVLLGTYNNYDFINNHLYPSVSIQEENTGVENIECNLNPYMITTSLAITLTDTTEENLFDNFMLGSVVATNVYLTFTEISKVLLGFYNNDYILRGISRTFIAEKSADKVSSSPSIALELKSLPLESYEGKSGTKKSILGIIPSLKIDENNNIQYAPSNLIPIDINNKYLHNMNQIKMRLINYDDNSVLSIGSKGISITLVVI